MAYDTQLAERVRQRLAGHRDVVEKKMFGGLAFMVRGHMACGVIGDELMFRVGPEAYATALDEPHAREMDFTRRPLKGMVYVAPAGFADTAGLDAWLRRALDFVASLPPK